MLEGRLIFISFSGSTLVPLPEWPATVHLPPKWSSHEVTNVGNFAGGQFDRPSLQTRNRGLPKVFQHEATFFLLV